MSVGEGVALEITLDSINGPWACPAIPSGQRVKVSISALKDSFSPLNRGHGWE